MQNGKVGGRVRSYREKAELTRADLAERTGLDESFIRAIEEEDLYPSLQPLVKIARALDVRLGTFMDDQVSRDPLVVRAAERREELTMHHTGEDKAALRFHSLGRGKSDRHMEPFFIEILPESAENVKLSSHEGEEFIVVVSGQVEIRYGQETTILTEGDSVYYNSVVPHHVSAAGGEPAQIYAVIYFPE
ncbi:transcriptional regulator, XRE family with cupin sensor [Paucidesulfovibrio gracilis DSM 16080]|uniref:Transcriptional regulator, XRE family with cupin sensor n=1 Tax=Paucidesulfovibrio gracilis DSM 16080 TaxID=1121449 RepID=A0A1T4XP31_9BACT|nr:cupin domain-containing protein [Paucidesulfovibrio gracilis]SKA91113.1 transcriptional regulator, XRE family with cupin sensor [Paucidesulfovibrio gracilis DSM 16080]